MPPPPQAPAQDTPVETTPTKPRRTRLPTMRKVPLAAILTVFGVIILLAAIRAWSSLLLLSFGAILVAVALRGGGRVLNRYLHINIKLGVLITVVLVAVIAIIGIIAVGPAISEQLNQLLQGLPEAWAQIEDWLANSSAGQFIEQQLQPATGTGASEAAQSSLPSIFGFLTGTLSTLFGGIANIVLLITMAIFLALDGPTYAAGALRLVPIPYRPRAQEISDELGVSLGRWMAGQAVDMLAVALMTGFGLWALGMPLAMVLGLIAGLTNVIPYIGPFLSGTPAVLFALTQGFDMAVYVLLLFIFVQQFEGNILLPLIQKYAADLPPVLTVMAIVAFGGLFGFAGVLLATPLLMVLMILVKRIYIEDVLGDQLPPPLPRLGQPVPPRSDPQKEKDAAS